MTLTVSPRHEPGMAGRKEMGWSQDVLREGDWDGAAGCRGASLALVPFAIWTHHVVLILSHRRGAAITRTHGSRNELEEESSAPGTENSNRGPHSEPGAQKSGSQPLPAAGGRPRAPPLHPSAQGGGSGRNWGPALQPRRSPVSLPEIHSHAAVLGHLSCFALRFT